VAGLVLVYGQRLVGQPKELNHGRGLFDYTKWYGTLAVLFCDSSGAALKGDRILPAGK
jgi:hypothetical protein